MRTPPKASKLAVVVATGAALALTVGLAGPAHADSPSASAGTSTTATSTPFTTKTYAGKTPGTFNGLRFAGTGKPESMVIVYYDAPGKSKGVFPTRHIAETLTGSEFVSASGHYSFTARFPDLPRGAKTLKWHARLGDIDTLSVIGRVDGVRTRR